MKKIILSGILSISFLSIVAQNQKELWGVTEKGGESYGIIFKTDQNGDNQQIIHSFTATIGGKYPSYGKLCEPSPGKLYGVLNGGRNDNGIIIEFNTDSNKLIKKVDFKESINGSAPFGLVKAPNGKLYGVTHDEGTSQKGTIFEYDAASNTLTTKFNFTGSNGSSPYGVLAVAANGKLYGTTETGGSTDLGVLFEYDPATNVCTKKIDFTGINGSSPRGELISLKADKLVGTTYMGGTDDMGTVFEYTISTNTLSKKIDFKGTNGSYPIGGLCLANKAMYGNTLTGGASDMGLVFKLDSTYAFKKIIDLSGSATGSYPHANLTLATNGILYGTGGEGGANDGGTIFQVAPTTDTFTKLYDFSSGMNGRYPYSTLMQAANGKLYGTTIQGGSSDRGSLFEFDIATTTFKKRSDFEGGIEGEAPRGTLMMASNGKVYGATSSGGSNGLGILFECDPAVTGGAFKKKIDFAGTSNGNRPAHAPVEVNGKLYGTTEAGGTTDKGVLYVYDPVNGLLTKKVDFNGAEKGEQPGALIKAPNNKLYGMTTRGGTNNQGVIYEYDPATETFTKKIDLKAVDYGAFPYNKLLLASNGKMYGLTSFKDATHKGTLFEYDYMKDTIIKRIDFGGTGNGYSPMGELVEASNGKLYGLTTQGGTADKGTIFEYDPTTFNYAVKYSFNGIKGAQPYGGLALSFNDKLYGMTSTGGSNDVGVMFEYTPADTTIKMKLNFNGTNGQNPYYTTLLPICSSFTLTPQTDSIAVCETHELVLHSGGLAIGYTFQWYKNDTLIPAATAIDYTIASTALTDSGKYYCLVSNGCKEVKSTVFKVVIRATGSAGCEITGIRTASQHKQIFIYPNPVRDQLTMQLTGDLENHVNIVIIDLLGKVVLQENAVMNKNQNLVQLNVAGLNNGIYLLKVMTADQHVLEVEKLVKY
ncbi:MAG TPA: choice-of-anchor tandem repeat GloVer-containing protein [Bacteroidia bacterium]|jgi:uncharacterized repeat protein (TIGR03803 family)|nr:choice-of-anchor tandem repeat GloVer-containing protein [Bacteroidia bacterium]